MSIFRIAILSIVLDGRTGYPTFTKRCFKRSVDGRKALMKLIVCHSRVRIPLVTMKRNPLLPAFISHGADTRTWKSLTATAGQQDYMAPIPPAESDDGA